MKIFTIENGSAEAGVRIEEFILKAGVTIPALVFGEEGRGRRRAVVPVAGQFQIDSPLLFGEVGQTKTGNPKIFGQSGAGGGTDSECLVLFRTHMGYRGGNSHTGDLVEEYYQIDRVHADGNYDRHWTREEAQVHSLELMKKTGTSRDYPQDEPYGFDRRRSFAKFPGTILATGIIAQGDAGAMGNGEQLLAIVPKGVVFRTAYSGRLYGAPSAHYHLFDGGKIVSLTKEERDVSELF